MGKNRWSLHYERQTFSWFRRGRCWVECGGRVIGVFRIGDYRLVEGLVLAHNRVIDN